MSYQNIPGLPAVPDYVGRPVSPIPGLKALSIGDIGTGKTTMIKSLLDCGVKPLCIFTEPGQEVVGDVDKSKLHWMYIPPLSPNIQNLRDAAKKVGTQGPDLIQKGTDTNRDRENQYYPILDAMATFKCDRTGEVFGNVGTWGTDKCLVIDSLSGITVAANKLAVGEKYAMTQPEFQIAMKVIENLVRFLTSLHCHVYLTAHPEKELDEVNGGLKIYPSTLGRKLAPVIGRDFSDVFLTKMIINSSSKAEWYLDTISNQAVLKARNFPLAMNQRLSFVPAFETWKKKGGLIVPGVPE